MGMSSSQARLLSLTARMHDIESKAQKVQAEKLRLANESDRVYNEYLDALDATKIQYKNISQSGTIDWADATLASIENGMLETYSGQTSKEQYFLQDTQTGAIYLSVDYAASKGITSDSEIFTGSLDDWLEAKHAPKVLETYVDGYTTTKDESVVTSVKCVGNSGFEVYNPSSYTYENAVSNSTSLLSNTLVSGKTYTISTADDLLKLSQLSKTQNTYDVTIYLANDINMSTAAGFESISNFRGTFNGNGHAISGLNTSLFDYLNNANVSNLNLVSSNVNSRGVLSNTSTNSTISNISATGNITSSINGAGGFIGADSGSTISKCRFSGSVSGNVNVGGFIGSATGSTITNCSSSGTVDGKVQTGGFIGGINGATISHCSSNEIINIRADETTGNPDSGGFIGVASNTSGRASTITNCSAAGTLNDRSTSGHNTIDSGFMSFANQGVTTISNCNSSVNLNTNQVYAVGFVAIWNSHDATLYVNNCNYTGNINSSNLGSVGFTHVESGSSASHTIKITDCYTSSTITKYSDNGRCTNLGMTWKSTANSNDTSVATPSITTGSIPDSIEMSLLGSSVNSIPSINSSNDGAYLSNIMAVFVKAGEYDPHTATSAETTDLQTKIKTFLSGFSDNDSDNSKLYYLNKHICEYLDGTDDSISFATSLIADVNNPSLNSTSIYQSGIELEYVDRTAGSSWTPTYHSVEKGSLNVPSKETIKANILAVAAKEGSEITSSQIDSFLSLYDAGQEDLAYLAFVNDYLSEYNSTTRPISVLFNKISSTPPQKLAIIPDYIDDINNYNITQEGTDRSSEVEVNHPDVLNPIEKTRMVFDRNAQETIDLTTAYYMQLNGFVIIGDSNDSGMDKSPLWLSNMIKSGQAHLVKSSDLNAKNNEVSISTDTNLQEVSYEENIKKAEAKYEADMRHIDRKDRRYDEELTKFDNIRTALKEECDTLKTVIRDNVDLNFKLFS